MSAPLLIYGSGRSLLSHLIGRGSELINSPLAAERFLLFLIFFFCYYLTMKHFKGNTVLEAVLEVQEPAIGLLKKN